MCCKYCHPEGVCGDVVRGIAELSDGKSQHDRSKEEDFIPGKPEYMAKHLRFACQKMTDDAQNDAKEVLHERDAREKSKSTEIGILSKSVAQDSGAEASKAMKTDLEQD